MPGIQETIGMLEGNGHQTFSIDLSDSEHIPMIIGEGVDKMGRINGVANCAGISGVFPLKTMSQERILTYLNTNVVSHG